MTSDDQQIPVCIVFNDLFRKQKISFYCLNEVFFAIISYLGPSSFSLLVVYLVNLS